MLRQVADQEYTYHRRGSKCKLCGSVTIKLPLRRHIHICVISVSSAVYPRWSPVPVKDNEIMRQGLIWWVRLYALPSYREIKFPSLQKPTSISVHLLELFSVSGWVIKFRQVFPEISFRCCSQGNISSSDILWCVYGLKMKTQSWPDSLYIRRQKVTKFDPILISYLGIK